MYFIGPAKQKLLLFWTDTCPDGRLTENRFKYISVNSNPKEAVYKGRPWTSEAGGLWPTDVARIPCAMGQETYLRPRQQKLLS